LLLSVVSGHERPSPLVWAGVASTLSGMVLVVSGGPGVRLGGSTLLGDVLMVAAAIAWSAYTVGSRGLTRRYGPLRTTAWTLWVGSAGLVVLGVPALAVTPLGEVSSLGWGGVV